MNTIQDWFWELLGATPLREGEQLIKNNTSYILSDGVLRQKSLYSPNQTQTQAAFSYKWAKRDTFDSPQSLSRMRQWLVERYGSPTDYPWLTLQKNGIKPIVLDAGCGAGMSGFEYFEPVWQNIHYIGADISSAVDVAKQRAYERKLPSVFLQADLASLPIPPESIDVIFSEGVLHHTDSTENAFKSLVPLLKKDGRIMVYIYKKKGPIREFTDDYVRNILQSMSEEEAWQALVPLTKLGISLGKLQTHITIEEPVELLQIPAGTYDIQRFFYWHVAKMFYREDLTLDELNHINFDWYYPKNAHRHTPEELRKWCSDMNLIVEREVIQDSGITIIARKNC